MGTNYYRIPLEEEMIERKLKLIEHICALDISPYSTERGFATIPSGEWDAISPWDEFRKDTSIHLGKRSSGVILDGHALFEASHNKLMSDRSSCPREQSED
jgi:hypothetical protein